MTADDSTGTYINTVLSNNNIEPTINITGVTDNYAIALVDDASSVLKSALTADKSLNETQLKIKGFSIDKMIVSCYFNKAVCTQYDFNWRHTNQFGNCYTFNDLILNGTNVDSKSTSKAGPEYGLNLELFIGISGMFILMI